MILLLPRASNSDGALQVAVPHVPTFWATPLPPRSLTQVTLLILRSSAAEPDRLTVEVVVAYVPAFVGALISMLGTPRSMRSSASSRSAAFGSIESDSVAPPHAARMTQAAATGASLRWACRKLLMNGLAETEVATLNTGAARKASAGFDDFLLQVNRRGRCGGRS